MSYRASTTFAPSLAFIFASALLSQITGQSGSWTDPESHLVWAAQDNGEDISWKASKNYCQKLRLAGFSDWRMPEMAEAQGLYDKRAESPGTMGAKQYHNIDAATWHVKGRIFLTGVVWTAHENSKEKCLWTCYASHFDFNEGKADSDPVGWPYPYNGRRALCVRGPQAKTQASSDGANL